MSLIPVGASTTSVVAVIPNDGNSIPPWLFIVGVVVIIAVAAVMFARRKR